MRVTSATLGLPRERRVTAEGMRISVDLPMVRFSAGPTVDRSVLTSTAAGAATLALVTPFVVVTPLVTAGACAWAVAAPSMAARAIQREADKGLRTGFFMVASLEFSR